MVDVNLDKELASWSTERAKAERFALGVSEINRCKAVLIRINGRILLGGDATDVLRAHRASGVSLGQTLSLLEQLMTMQIKPCRVDLGRLAQSSGELEQAVSVANAQQLPSAPRDVVLYGFGRIGRLLARTFIERSGPAALLRLRAVVVRKTANPLADLQKRVDLLRRDSVHGRFNATLDVDEENLALVANGVRIRFIYAERPEAIDYPALGINRAVIIDNTGVWRDREGLGQHLSAKGVDRVLLTAPGKGDIPNIVFGVNETDITDEQRIISAASCTTNAITPVLKALDERFSVQSGHVETVHSYTNDQNLIDNFHKAERRGRAAALNMVITSTGAAKAVAKAYPVLAGKLTGNAIRVPTPNVSLAILNLTLGNNVSVDSLNDFLAYIAQSADYQKQIGFSRSAELVSSDLVGSREAGVVDSLATIAEGNRCVLYLWYDNEFGYAQQVFRVAQQMAGIELVTVPN